MDKKRKGNTVFRFRFFFHQIFIEKCASNLIHNIFWNNRFYFVYSFLAKLKNVTRRYVIDKNDNTKPRWFKRATEFFFVQPGIPDLLVLASLWYQSKLLWRLYNSRSKVINIHISFIPKYSKFLFRIEFPPKLVQN